MHTNGPDYTTRDIRRLIMAWLDANNLMPPHTDVKQAAIEALVIELRKLNKQPT
jgi:hypothetical protein